MDDNDVPPGFEDEEPPRRNDDGRDQPDLSLQTPGLADDSAPPQVDVPDPDFTAATSIYNSGSKFEDFGLSQELLKALYEMHFERPSQIQAETLPRVLAPPYKHLIAQGHNGCGKTTCFALAMLSRVDPGEQAPQALCMCPARELVIQNLEVLRKLGKHTGITAIGTNEMNLRSRDRITQQIIVGTAGTLENVALKVRRLALDRMRVLVFDEADQMMKVDGFQDQSIRMITAIRSVSPDVQMLLFSASFEDNIKQYCIKVIPGATKIFIKKEELSLDVIKQYRVDVNGEAEKVDVLKEYIFQNADRLGQTIVFVERRKTADSLHSALNADGFKCLQLGGHLTNDDRDLVAQRFKNMETKILIATDVIARGFDVNTVTLVVNFDLPVDVKTGGPAYDTYQHRIGRSGRFGAKGAAFNFVDHSKHRGLSDVEIVDSFSKYFQREIHSIPAHDEQAFFNALAEAGLARVGQDTFD